jgi:hypothetical protein
MMITPVRATLYIVGAIFELFGIVLVATPDLVPGVIRLARWTRVHWRLIENRFRRWLGLPLHTVVRSGSAVTTAGFGARVSGLVSTGAATIEAKVEYLLRREQEAQRAVNALSERVESLEAATSQRFGELRDELMTHVADELAAAQADYRTARIGGAITLALGLALTTAGNFV